MSLPTFPAYAKVTRDDNERTPNWGVLRTEMDGAVPKQRSRWSRPIIRRNVVAWLDSAADYQAFEQWVGVTLQGGAGWFTWVEAETGRSYRAHIVDGKVAYRHMGGPFWQAKFEMEYL
ncbi:hypothetical protein [Chitiniphilus shinanonensis]|uniref:hypothetical protein n=1 Tax=Chitiniphilus shinanonensis TaxID=553088 RepID=UPI00306BB3D6